MGGPGSDVCDGRRTTVGVPRPGAAHFTKILRAAGVPTIRPYDLRHTCATLRLKAGQNPRIVSERLGHESVSLTLDTYSHVLPDMQEESAVRLERLINYKDGSPCTILLNRKRIERSVPYDVLAWRYDGRYRSEEALREQQEVLRRIDGLGLGPISSLSVLDVGCGMGTLLQHASPARYVGLDPSAGMLAELRHRYPHAATVQTPLARFVPAAKMDRYDLVLSLFGTGSYLSDAELGRIPCLLRPGGRAVTMFYAPGFTPEQYRSKKAVQVERRTWQRGMMPGTITTNATANFVTVVTPPAEERT